MQIYARPQKIHNNSILLKNTFCVSPKVPNKTHIESFWSTVCEQWVEVYSWVEVQWQPQSYPVPVVCCHSNKNVAGPFLSDSMFCGSATIDTQQAKLCNISMQALRETFMTRSFSTTAWLMFGLSIRSILHQLSTGFLFKPNMLYGH